MSILRKWREYSARRRARRWESFAKVVRNPKAIREDRLVAIDHFMQSDDPDTAVPALLKRFEFSLEHGIFDEREKDMCMEGILKFGERGLPHIRQNLRESHHIAWPIKILNKLTPAESVLEDLKSALNYGDIAFDEALVSKNYDILCYLRDYKWPGFWKKLTHFLEDHDERVRFACIEALLEQDDPEIPPLVEPYMSDESAENRRLRRAVIDAFLTRHWIVSQPEKFAHALVERGIAIGMDRRLFRLPDFTQDPAQDPWY
jgi:hypothetical protein